MLNLFRISYPQKEKQLLLLIVDVALLLDLSVLVPFACRKYLKNSKAFRARLFIPLLGIPTWTLQTSEWLWLEAAPVQSKRSPSSLASLRGCTAFNVLLLGFCFVGSTGTRALCNSFFYGSRLWHASIVSCSFSRYALHLYPSLCSFTHQGTRAA